MRLTVQCKVIGSVLLVGWATSAHASLDLVRGHAMPWWFELWATPTAVALLAAVSLGMFVWRCAAPASILWDVAFEAGRKAGEAASVENVVPMLRRESAR